MSAVNCKSSKLKMVWLTETTGKFASSPVRPVRDTSATGYKECEMLPTSIYNEETETWMDLYRNNEVKVNFE